MGIKEIYEILPITYKAAMDIVVKNHYLHRKGPCSNAYGLFEIKTGRIAGVITYGKPASDHLCRGICGNDESPNVVELTRLWVEDATPKNVESFLIANTIKMLDKEIIVSYADSSQNHLGIVYQATNWIYTGLSDRHVKWRIEGMGNVHSRHWQDQYGGLNNAKKILGDLMIREERPRKHRYIYFNCNKWRKRELVDKLRYKPQPYPKEGIFCCLKLEA